MKSNTFTRLYAALIGFILFVFFINYAFSLKSFRDYAIKSGKENLFRVIDSHREKIEGRIKDGRDIAGLLKEISESRGVPLRLLDPSGKIIAGLHGHPSEPETLAQTPEFIEASTGGRGSSHGYSASRRQQAISVVVRTTDGYYIQASSDLQSMNEFLNVYKKNIFFVAIILVSISLAVSFFLTRSFADPLVRLARVSEIIASGNFDVEIPDIKGGELSGLATSFRLMTEEIKKLFGNISRQKEELASIIDAVNDLLLIINFKGVIVSASRKFEEFIHSDEINGRFYEDVIADKRIIQAIHKTLREKKPVIREFELQDKSYLCTTACLPEFEEAVIVLRDISELKNLETFKRDLVANASHELRTPLTAIKGYIETLKDEDIGPGRKYLEIIDRHTDRLIFIVQDLLILSRLEDKKLIMESKRVSLKEVIQDITHLLEKKAAQKNLKLGVDFDTDVFVRGDRNLLVQLFINLVDNAIKYTEKGSVRIFVQRQGSEVLILVSDTGIGIDPKHISRIFERFYVVDSSRSRSQGGTGLGLSIVKHIVQNHNGTISIKSEPGRGTEISVILPVDNG